MLSLWLLTRAAVLVLLLEGVRVGGEEYLLGGLFGLTGYAPDIQRAAGALFATRMLASSNTTSSSTPAFPSAQLAEHNTSISLLINDTLSSESIGAGRAYSFISGTWPTDYRHTRASLLDMDTPEHARTVGLVGASFSGISRAVSLVASVFEQPQISFSSTAPDLSDARKYESFCRVVPSDTGQARVLVELARRFGWTRIAVLGSSSSYGTGLSNSVIDLASARGVDVVAFRTFTSAREGDLLQALQAIRDARARVIYGHFTVDDAQHVLRVAADVGMIGKGTRYTWVASDGWVSSSLLETNEGNAITAADVHKIEAVLPGVVGVVPASFPEAFARIWEPVRAEYEAEFGQAAGSWSEVNVYTPFAFEVVWAFGHALLAVQRAGGDPRDGAQLLAAVKNVSYEGVTGHVQFDENCDRVSDYHVLNVRPRDGGSLEFRQIGVYVATAHSTAPLQLSEPVFWPDGLGDPPADEYRKLEQLNMSTEALIGVVYSMLLVLSLVLHVLLHVTRHDKYLKANSPVLGHAIVLGTTMFYVGVLALTFSSTSFGQCHAPIMFLFLGLSLVLGSLSARTFRIDRVFNSAFTVNMKHLTDSYMALFIAVLLAWDLFWSLLLYGLHPADIVLRKSAGNSDHDVRQCEYGNELAFLLLVVLPHVVLGVAAAVLAFRIRNVAYNFNESKSIAAALWALGNLAFIFTLLFVLVRGSPEAAALVVAGGVLVTSLSTLAILIVPRLFATFMRRRRIRQKVRKDKEAKLEDHAAQSMGSPGSGSRPVTGGFNARAGSAMSALRSRDESIDGVLVNVEDLGLDQVAMMKTTTCLNCGANLLLQKRKTFLNEMGALEGDDRVHVNNDRLSSMRSARSSGQPESTTASAPDHRGVVSLPTIPAGHDEDGELEENELSGSRNALLSVSVGTNPPMPPPPVVRLPPAAAGAGKRRSSLTLLFPEDE